MIRPGDELTPETFWKMKRELDRRARLWTFPPLKNSNLNTGSLIRGVAAGPTQPIVIARLQNISQTVVGGFDFIEVEYDEKRKDYVPKAGGRSTTPFGGSELAAYELNGAPIVNPINQVVVINPVVDNNGNPTFGKWWFDYRPPLDRNIIVLDRGQGGDCSWIGAPDGTLNNTACSPVGYRYGFAFGQAFGLFVAQSGFVNPCSILGAILSGCQTPNDGFHGDGVNYQSWASDILSETLHLTVPSGEVGTPQPDTITPGTYALTFDLTSRGWLTTLPGIGTQVCFGVCTGFIGGNPQPATPPTVLSGIPSSSNLIRLAFVSSNPFMMVILYSGSGGIQHLIIGP